MPDCSECPGKDVLLNMLSMAGMLIIAFQKDNVPQILVLINGIRRILRLLEVSVKTEEIPEGGKDN